MTSGFRLWVLGRPPVSGLRRAGLQHRAYIVLYHGVYWFRSCRQPQKAKGSDVPCGRGSRFQGLGVRTWGWRFIDWAKDCGFGVAA